MAQRKNHILLKRVAFVLRNLREDKGLTQQVVFDDTGIHVGRVETLRTNPTVTTISDLCDYFGMNVASFFELVEKAGTDEDLPRPLQ